jgi:cell division protein FtsW (lipid II flippase)
VVAEELGFSACVRDGALYTIFYRGYKLATNGRRFFRLPRHGIMVSINAEAVVNVGGNRIMPVTGVTPPFLSYGSSPS